MPWPTIPMLIFTDSTSWQKVSSWTTGKVADRVPSYGAMGPPLPCAVETISADTIDAHGRQSMVVEHRVTFDASTFPGLHIRDQGVWIEGNKTLTVKGVEPAGDANGRIYVVTCEERPLL